MASNEERLYQEQLKQCGFRSWKRANERRQELILLGDDGREYQDLSVLLRLYRNWKCKKTTAAPTAASEPSE